MTRLLRQCPLALGLAALLLVVATWTIRAIGPNDSPDARGSVFRHDETTYVGHVIRFLNGDWDVTYFTNPTFAMYVLYGATQLCGRLSALAGECDDFEHFRVSATVDASIVTRIGRGLTLCLAAASVLLLLRLGARTFSTPVGVTAAFALAVNATHASRSVLAGNEILTVFLVLVFLTAVAAYLDAPSVTRHALAGALLGLVAATKYNGGIHVLTLGAASWLAARGTPLRARTVGFAVVPLAFVLASPTVVLRFDRFVEEFAAVAGYLPDGYVETDNARGEVGWIAYVASFPRENDGLAFSLLVALGVLGGLATLARGRSAARFAFTFAVAPIACYAILGASHFSRMRFLLPVTPLYLLLGAAALAFVVRTALARLRVVDGRVVAVATLAVATAMLAPAAPKARAAALERARATASVAELRDWAATNLERDRRYVVFRPLSAGAAVLDERARVARLAIDPDGLSGAARDEWDRFDRTAHVAEPFGPILQAAPTIEALQAMLQDRGFDDLVAILPTRIMADLASLPANTAFPPVQQCAYWPDVVRWLASLERRHLIPTTDRQYVLAVLALR